jgi:c-di-GMP-binding flagellar brake protein YcgR
LSARGVGLRLDREVHIGERLSLIIPLDDGDPHLRVTVEVRHVRVDARSGQWRAGGLFRTLAPGDHEQIISCVFERTAP